jgi:hypothetical protein
MIHINLIGCGASQNTNFLMAFSFAMGHLVGLSPKTLYYDIHPLPK